MSRPNVHRIEGEIANRAPFTIYYHSCVTGNTEQGTAVFVCLRKRVVKVRGKMKGRR